MGAIIAIDPGTRLGFAVGYLWDAGRMNPRSGAVTVATPSDHPGERYRTVRDLLHELCPVGARVVAVAYELPHLSGRLAAQYHHGVIAVCQMFAAEVGADVIAVHSATLKKHATGNGRAEKEEMVQAARRARLVPAGYRFASHDEADALWILDYARMFYRRTHPAAYDPPRARTLEGA